MQERKQLMEKQKYEEGMRQQVKIVELQNSNQAKIQ